MATRRAMSTSLQILLFIALLIAAAKIAGSLATRFGLPAVLGELLAGVILGPTAINIWHMHWLAAVGESGASVASVFKVLAQIGVVILMFVAGLETDIQMAKQALKPAFWSATGGVVLPMAGGYLFSRWAGFDWQQSLFIGTILTATSVTITAQTLMNLNQIRSRSGSTILGAAVIDDVMGLIVLSLVIAVSAHGANGKDGSVPDRNICGGAVSHPLVDEGSCQDAWQSHGGGGGAGNRLGDGVHRRVVWWNGGDHRLVPCGTVCGVNALPRTRD